MYFSWRLANHTRNKRSVLYNSPIYTNDINNQNLSQPNRQKFDTWRKIKINHFFKNCHAWYNGNYYDDAASNRLETWKNIYLFSSRKLYFWERKKSRIYRRSKRILAMAIQSFLSSSMNRGRNKIILFVDLFLSKYLSRANEQSITKYFSKSCWFYSFVSKKDFSIILRLIE